MFAIDCNNKSFIEIITKVSDIIAAIGLDNVLDNGIEVHLINRWPNKSNNHILSIKGINKENE